jgi:hypothetical protein
MKIALLVAIGLTWAGNAIARQTPVLAPAESAAGNSVLDQQSAVPGTAIVQSIDPAANDIPVVSPMTGCVCQQMTFVDQFQPVYSGTSFSTIPGVYPVNPNNVVPGRVFTRQNAYGQSPMVQYGVPANSFMVFPRRGLLQNRFRLR